MDDILEEGKMIKDESFKTLGHMLERVREVIKCETIVETEIGWGRFVYNFIKAFPKAKYYGYDAWEGIRIYDEEMIKKTFSDNPNVILTKIKALDITEFPSADLIHINSVCFLKHELELALKCLKPNGIIIVNCIWMEPIKNIIDDWYKNNQKDYHLHLVNIELWADYKLAMIWRKK